MKENEKQKNINNETLVKKPKTWNVVESPNFFRFENIGDMVEGLLLSKDDISKRYGFGIYTLKTFEGEIKRFHGSTQLDDLLMNIDIPCYVQIEYIDNQETPNGTMKLFTVKKGSN